MSTLEVIVLVLAVLGALGGVLILWWGFRHVMGWGPEAAATKSDVERILEEIARGTAVPGTPASDLSDLAAQATEASAKKLEEALESYHAGEYREAIECVLSAYDRELPPLAKTELHVVAGNAYHGLSDYGAAEMHYKEALRAAPNADAEAVATGNLGLVYAGRGDLEGAEKYHRKALAIDEAIGDRLGQAYQLGNLGNVYAGRGDLEGAEEYHRKALDIFEEIGDELGQASEFGNLGGVAAERGDLEGAEEYHRKALDIFEEIGDRSGQAYLWGSLGNVYLRSGDLEGAEEHYLKGLDIAEEIGDRSGQARRLGNLGRVHAQRGHVEDAEEHYRSALVIAEEVGARDVVSHIEDLLEELKDERSA